jgi:hypothetical protein
LTAERCARANRQAGGGGGIGDGHDACRMLGGNRGVHQRRMDVDAVADDLGDDLVGLQHRAGEAGRTMTERRHFIEEVRRLTGAGSDRGQRLVVRRA